MLQSLLHRDLLPQSGLIEVVGSISHCGMPHLWLHCGLITSDHKAFGFLFLSLHLIVGVIHCFREVLFGVSLHLLESALNGNFELLLEDLVFGLLFELVVQLISIKHFLLL